MLRKTLNASRLQAEVSRRLHKLQEVIDDGVKFVVPRPRLQSADRTGCNWTMKHFGNAAGFEAVIAEVLATVQAEYNLASDEDDREAAGDPRSVTNTNPFGEAAGPAEKANPFGVAAGPAKVSNPFGEGAPKKAGDPFSAEELSTPVSKRPANPFGGD